MNVESSIICINQKLGTNQTFINRSMDKQAVVYSYTGIQLSNEKNDEYEILWMNLNNMVNLRIIILNESHQKKEGVPFIIFI